MKLSKCLVYGKMEPVHIEQDEVYALEIPEEMVAQMEKSIWDWRNDPQRTTPFLTIAFTSPDTKLSDEAVIETVSQLKTVPAGTYNDGPTHLAEHERQAVVTLEDDLQKYKSAKEFYTLIGVSDFGEYGECTNFTERAMRANFEKMEFLFHNYRRARNTLGLEQMAKVLPAVFGDAVNEYKRNIKT